MRVTFKRLNTRDRYSSLRGRSISWNIMLDGSTIGTAYENHISGHVRATLIVEYTKMEYEASVTKVDASARAACNAWVKKVSTLGRIIPWKDLNFRGAEWTLGIPPAAGAYWVVRYRDIYHREQVIMSEAVLKKMRGNTDIKHPDRIIAWAPVKDPQYPFMRPSEEK